MVKSKHNDKLISEVAELLLPRVEAAKNVMGGPSGMKYLVEKLLEMGILDERKCTIALVRHFVTSRVSENQSTGKHPSIMEVMSEAADAYCVSETFVQNCLYKYRDINL